MCNARCLVELKCNTQAFKVSITSAISSTVCQQSALNPGIGWPGKDPPVGGRKDAFVSFIWSTLRNGTASLHRCDLISVRMRTPKDATSELRYSSCVCVFSFNRIKLHVLIHVSRSPWRHACLCAVGGGGATRSGTNRPNQDSHPTHHHQDGLLQQISQGLFTLATF